MPFYKKTNYERINEQLLIERNRLLEKAMHITLRIVVPLISIISIIEPLIPFNCDEMNPKVYPNPDYRFTTGCHWQRHLLLLGMCQVETMLARRMLLSAVLGATIGFQRRPADRPAGIRTMSLVAMGACLFTLTSMFSFQDGPMTWDSSRVSAAIPSGVGFLGAGLIWKSHSKNEGDNGEEIEIHQVHGLTTAASVWLAASVGVAAAGGLYIISVYSVMLIILVVKFGPQLIYEKEDTIRQAMYDAAGRIPRTDSDAWNSFHDFPSQEPAGAEEDIENKSPFSSPENTNYGATSDRKVAADPFQADASTARASAASSSTRSQLGGRPRSEQSVLTGSVRQEEGRPLLRPHKEKSRDGEATYTD